MMGLRKSLIGGLLGLAALAASPAHADLIASCTSTSNPAACGTTFPGGTHSGNDTAIFTGSVGHFTSILIVLNGQDNLSPPDLLDVHNLEMTINGAGEVKFSLEENGLTGTGLQSFLMNFQGVSTSGAITSVAREFFVNGVSVGTCGASACSFTSPPVSLSGTYSITETIDITAGAGCTRVHLCLVSSDDIFSTVPEPGALSLFGLGLLALGGFTWKRRRRDSLV